MRWRLMMSAAAAVATAVAAGCTGTGATWQDGGQTPAGSAAPGAIAWHDCAGDASEIAGKLRIQTPVGVTFQCGTVVVPQDWNTARDGRAADGKTFEIALLRARSNQQTQRIGSLLTNPGGPGASGFDYTVYLASQFSGLMKRFDLIGFDPRGVGRSAPVKCISDADLDASFRYEPDPVSDADFQGLVALSRKIAGGCSVKYGENLRLFSTEQAARDIDAIRTALGEEKLNYLGYSYGTLLGAVHARLFAKNIRAMVLDGAVDPRQSPIAGSEGQVRGFERAFGNFATWCRQNAGSTCPIAPDAGAAVANTLNTARTSAVDGRDGRQATTGWIFTAVVSSLYSQEAWPFLARAISDLQRGDSRVLFLLADNYAERDSAGHYTNFWDANNAVNCADSDDFPSVKRIRALQAEWRDKYPLFGAPLALSMLNCSLWLGKQDPYPVGPATGSPPIVVVGTTGDPATPYESTPKLAGLLGTGTVVTWNGEGHTAYPETPCIRTAVDAYLIDLKIPANGLTCPAR